MAVKPIKIAIIANAAQAQKELGAISRQTSKLGQGFKTFGKVAAAGLAVATGAAVKLGVSSAKLAAEAEQNLGGSEAVFGKYADTMKKKGAEAYRSLGVSQSDYLATANKMGSLFQGSGIEVQKSVDLTSKAMQRAADVASVMGVDMDMAMESVAGAAKGNFTMMDNLGVAMNAANIEAYALSKGMNFKWNTATQAQKTEVAMKMFFDKTSKYAGNFERESTETLSGAMGALRAQVQNLMADVGMKLLPVLTRFTTWISSSVVPAVQVFGDTMKAKLAPWVDKARDSFGQLQQAVQPLGDWLQANPALLKGVAIALGVGAVAAGAFALAMGAVAVATAPLTLVVVGIAALGAALTLAWQKSETFRSVTLSVWAAVQSTISTVISSIRSIIASGTAVAQAVWRTFGATILTFISKTMKNIGTVVRGALKVVQGIFKTVSSLLRGDWKGMWDGIKQILSGALGIIKGLFSQGWNVLRTVTSAAWNGIKTAVSSGVGKMMDIVRGVPGKIKGAFSGARSMLSEIGKDIIRGLGDGLDAMWGWVQDKISKLTDKIPGWVKKKLGIQSPSRVMRKLAKWIPAGIAKGIEDGEKGVQKALNKVTKRIEKSIKGKNEKKREKAVLKALRDEYKALTKNAKAHDKITARIKAARTALDAAKKAAADYAAGIKDGVMAFGGVTAVDEGHMNNPAALVDQMRGRLDQAKRFADLITQLTGKLNKTSLQELIDKGVEGGLAAAEALVAGGPATIAEVNKITAELNTVGTNLGKHAATQFHQAGIDAAQGLVNGLLKQEKKIEKTAKKLAKKLVKAIKKELGIKSPSRVGKDLGQNFASSIDLGANVIPLHRTGRTLARDLTKGFGTPTLTARTGWDVGGGPGSRDQIAVKVHLSADQISQMERGRRYDADITAYRRRGGAA